VTALLAEAEWRARRTAHERRVDGWLAGHLARRRAGTKHPVEDFLLGKVRITNTLPHRGSHQQQWAELRPKHRPWSDT
jgi:hypothetical protein